MTPGEARLRRRAAKYLTRHVKPIEGEPAHGFLMRLAAAHRERSAVAFAALFDIDLTRFGPGECLAAVCASPLAGEDDMAMLRRWTPMVATPLTTIAGEVVRRGDFTLRSRRFCPGCLGESPHHRFWFDLSFMGECPFHGAAIGDGPDGEAAANWSWSDLGVLPSGKRIAREMPARATLPDTLEAYALRRFGLAPARPDAWLDPVPLAEVVEACEVLGRLVVGGRLEVCPLLNAPGFEGPALRAAGWPVLARGRAGVEALLRRIAAQAPPDVFGGAPLFGWFFYNLHRRCPFVYGFLGVANQVATDLGRDGSCKRRSRDVEAIRARGLSTLLTIAETALLIGAGEGDVDDVVRALDLAEPHCGRKGLPLLIARRKAGLIHRIISAKTLSRPEAIAFLEMDERDFGDLVRAGHLAKHPLRDGNAMDAFAVSEIARFLDSIPLIVRPHTIDCKPDERRVEMPMTMYATLSRMLVHTGIHAGDFFDGVFDGKLKVYARTGYRRGLGDFRIRLRDQDVSHPFYQRWLSISMTRGPSASDDTISQQEACALLDIDHRTVLALTTLGHLGRLEGKQDNQHFTISRASADAFAKEWAAGKIYARQLGVSDQQVPRTARDAGLQTFFEEKHPDEDLGKVRSIYRRRDMAQAFALSCEPEDADAALRGWKRAARRLGLNKSIFMIWLIGPGFKAKFMGAKRKWPIEVTYVFGADAMPEGRFLEDGFTLDRRAVYAIDAKLGIDGAEALARKEDFEAKIARGLPMGMTAAVGTDEDGKPVLEASMRAVLVVDDEEGLQPDELFDRYVVDDLRATMQMLNMLKCTFEDGSRTFDPKVFGLWPACFTRIRPRCDEPQPHPRTLAELGLLDLA